MKKTSKLPVLYDPHIIARVKQYLEDNVHQTYVNVSEMARALQEKHVEYNRRKSGPFKSLVQQAYQIVLHSYGLDSNSSSEVEETSEIELVDEEPSDEQQQYQMGNLMNNLYNKKPSSQNHSTPPPQTVTQPPLANNSTPAPIDISSDESDGESSSQNPSKNPMVRNGDHADSTVPHNFGLPNEISIHKSSKQTTLDPNPIKQSRKIPPLINQQIAKKRKLEVPVPKLVSTVKVPKRLNSKRDFVDKKSTVMFKDVGGLEKILKELCELLLHLKHSELYEHIGLNAPRGFLLHGPPGSGKTLLAHAIAGQLDIPILEVAATELVAGISGESEERIREVFEKAASIAPCILFIDEVDVISANRNNAQKDLERRIVAQLLSSLDGLGSIPNGKQVLVIGATNRADSLDPALRRVGRFDQEICLGIPDRTAREQILRVICEKLKLEKPFDFDQLAVLTPGYVGADLLALAMRAASLAIKRVLSSKGVTPIKETESEELVQKETETVTLMEVDQIEEVNKPTEKEPESIKEAEEAKEKEPVIVEAEHNGTEKETNEIEPISNEIEKSQEKPEDQIATQDQPETADKNQNTPTFNHSLEDMVKWLENDKGSPISEEDIKNLFVTMGDFTEALRVVQPSAKREGFITVPDVTWEDIGSLQDIRDELKLAILAPVKYPKKLEALGLQSPSGVLLCGPPGCGKTLLAKAVANEAGINFISVKGPELLNMYVGESERAVRQCFQRAKNSAPCVIFFDEFDALCPKRSNRSENSSGVRVVNQLLTEMDGVEDRKGVFLMAATNRPDMIDGAVLRPGRLDKILYVGLPESEDREDILKALTKNGTKPKLDGDVSLNELASLADGFTGADLGGLVREASLQALKESLLQDDETLPEEQMSVKKRHFLEALKNIKPSVSDEDKKNYDRLKKLYAAPKKD